MILVFRKALSVYLAGRLEAKAAVVFQDGGGLMLQTSENAGRSINNSQEIEK